MSDCTISLLSVLGNPETSYMYIKNAGSKSVEPIGRIWKMTDVCDGCIAYKS